MKKLSLTLLTAALMALTYTTYAQTFSIGPRVGVNFANLTTNNNSDNATNTLLVAGITSTYSISENSGIGVDLLYSGEGAENPGGDLALNYLRMPIMFQYFFGQLGEDFRPKIYAGVAPGLLVNAERGETEVINSYKKFDIAGTAGLGFHYRLGRTSWLNTDVRYLRGFSDITESASELFNEHWQVSLGVSFGIE